MIMTMVVGYRLLVKPLLALMNADTTKNKKQYLQQNTSIFLVLISAHLQISGK
jgi:hypothetical protein